KVISDVSRSRSSACSLTQTSLSMLPQGLSLPQSRRKCLVCVSRRLRPQVDHQASNTNAEPDQRITERDEGCDCEGAKSRDGPEIHDSAHPRRDGLAGAYQLPNQKQISRVHQEEDRCIEGNWLRGQFAH